MAEKRIEAEVQGLRRQIAESERAGNQGDPFGFQNFASESSEYVRLYRDLKYAEALYEVYARFSESISVEEMSSSLNAQVIESPYVDPVVRPRAWALGLIGLVLLALLYLEQWRALVRSALEKRSLEEENRSLRERLGESGSGELIGRSRRMEELRAFLGVVGASQAAVLIQGESGTGKELAARAIHRTSARREAPFVGLNCGALPAQLLESELFGYERGAFTGASAAKPGHFEQAHGGTIFLDEIGECSPELQVRLLRVLQEKEVQRLGGTRRLPTDFRLVAATNRDLAEDVRAGRFREDLFYRINVVGVAMPPLRERREDIPLLAAFFLDRVCRREGKALEGIAGPALELLAAHDWPGNVRELENAVERGVVVARGAQLEAADLPPHVRPADPAAGTVGALAARDLPLADVEKALVAAALARHGGNKSQAARALGISRKLLYSKLREHGLGGVEAPDAEEA
jgi:two-component system response regulator HydG